MSPYFCSQISPQAPTLCRAVQSSIVAEQQSFFVFGTLKKEILGQRFTSKACNIRVQCTFLGGSRIMLPKVFQRNISNSKDFVVSASWLTSSMIASNAFTWATVSVLPFYTLMVLAPNATLTRRAMKSDLPYVVLGLVYAFLLYHSWSPDTLRLMFASKYWLPELPGISKMFMNEMTLASAWIHLLAIDLYAARQVYYDGIKNNVETRHSVSLCLLFCPIGIIIHVITKVLAKAYSD
ncbi:hypothetical protein KFK09_026777 [Dendrobium nobile]|uniref:Protein ABA DEFICIENT 4, chloroplastic-like n=1 Tax=Dendrobium nobile TaxID=94219 RepID=A0A8T3A908_DENNO|nr:hypothetical protein KFK09_026777 [Dendrobium nobile]